MRRTDIVNALIAKGYQAEEKNSVKNGVIFEGILIRSDERIAPIIYTQGLIEEAERRGMHLSEVVSQVISMYENNRIPDFNIDDLLEREFILSHIRIGLQKSSDQDLIRKETSFEGIEKYLYIKGSKRGLEYAVKLSGQHLKNARINIDEAWERAEENTFAVTKICSIGDILAELAGMEPDGTDTHMYVITNQDKIQGASAVLDHEAIHNFFEGTGVDTLAVLPSSIHEMLLVPIEDGEDLEDMSRMVHEINETQVRPEERLTDRAYIMRL